MSQHDLTIANQGFPAFRADLNDALQALGSCQSGTSAPSPTFANQLWYDTTNNILKIRNEDNDAWISIATLDQSGDLVALLVANTVNSVGDSTINGLTVGKGGGAVASNTAVGASALVDGGNTGTQQVAIGNSSLFANTSGTENVAVGSASLFTNTTGSSNVAIGRSALRFNTTASNNTAVGYQAGYSNTTGTLNVAVGYQALYSTTTQNQNTAIGGQALYSNTTGYYGTAVGYLAGYSVTTGYSNTLIGQNAGYYITTGVKNSVLGSYNGNQGNLDIRTASNYIVLSDGDGNPRGFFDANGTYCIGSSSLNGREKISLYSSTGENFTSRNTADTTYAQMLLKSSTASSGTHYMLLFRNSADSIVGYITHNDTNTTYATSSDYRLKEDIKPMTGALAKVSALKPCTYTWKSNGTKGEGFIAHELAEVVPSAVIGEKDAVNDDGSIKSQAIDTSFLVATLTASIQELHEMVKAQALEIATLKAK